MKIALIAGETSGDQLGGWLMQSLKVADPSLQFIGLGGDRMTEQGLQSLFPMQEIALMGFAEILPHIFRLKRRIRETAAFIEGEQPDILVTIDSPGFVFRVVKELRQRGKVRPRFIHYVAPTVWAYKPERAKKTAALFDQLLVLFPFEPPYFEREGLNTVFIGNQVAWEWKTRGDGAAFRHRHAIVADTPLLAIFPGSRHGELDRLLPIISKSIEKLAARIPRLQVVVQVPEPLKIRLDVEAAAWKVPALIFSNREEKKDLFAAATAALAKSGTIGLECALAGLPAIIIYKVNAVTIWLIRRMLRISQANMANLLLGREILPELIQEDCTPEKIVDALLPLLTDETVRKTQRDALLQVGAMLGADDFLSPSDKAAKAILTLSRRERIERSEG